MAWSTYYPNKSKKGLKSKYKAEKTVINGIQFDSKKEAYHWAELKALEKAGEIHDLQRQVKFVLIPAQREPDTVGARGGIIKGKLIERECAYIADFTYFDKHGIFHVEDAKGCKDGEAYALFVIKRKLMLYIHGIRIKEV